MRAFIHLATLLVAASFVAVPLAAQGGIFAITPDTKFVGDFFIDRGVTTPNGNPGDCLAEMPAGLVDGVGHNSNGVCGIDEMYLNLQDQNAATIEPFGIVIRPRDPATGGPNTAAGAAIIDFIGAPLQTPGGTGVLAWIFTVGFQTPLTVPCGTYFYGARLPAITAANDGLYAQLAHYTQGTFGDNPRVGTRGLAWSVDRTTGGIGQHNWVWSVGLGPTGPTLQMGGDDPTTARIAPITGQGTTSFGAAGFFPDVTGAPRSDGIKARISDSGHPGALTAILLGFGISPTPFNIAGIDGQLRLNIGFGVFDLPGGLLPTATPWEIIFPLAPPGSIPVGVVGAQLALQGVVVPVPVGSANPVLTNVVAVQL